MKRVSVLFTLLLMLSFSSQSAKAIDIVLNGKAKSAIIITDAKDQYQRIAAEDFAERVRVASGAELPIFEIGDIDKCKKSLSKIYITATAPDSKPLEAEEYRVVEYKGDLYICGKNRPNRDERHVSRVSMWALSHVMETYMGVKWLWPGELGTITPKMENIIVPDGINYRHQPKLVCRRLDIVYNVHEEMLSWCARNCDAGNRENNLYQHSFRKGMSNGDWWGKFYETQPDMLAQSPDGGPKIQSKDDFYKICVSNPKCIDEVIRCWKAAGSPDYWDITPNDGNGFCTCERCQALDYKYNGVKYTKEEIWFRRTDDINLSGRYVWFWNQVVTRMHETNPKTQVGVFLYSAYKYPPKNLKLAPGVIGRMVDGFDFANWHAWINAGISGISLRPNWLYMGAAGPHLALEKAGKYIEQARVNSMHHIVMDAIHEFWATQGVYYYMIARMIDNYDFGWEEAVNEYCEAFGDAEPYIREYIEYWERYSNDVVKFNIPAGGMKSQDPNGLYETASKKYYNSVMHPLQGHWRIMPYIYGADIQAEARAILDKAEAATDDAQTKKRVDFIREGLNMVNVVSEYILSDDTNRGANLQAIIDYGNFLKEKFGYWACSEVPMMTVFEVANPDADLSDM